MRVRRNRLIVRAYAICVDLLQAPFTLLILGMIALGICIWDLDGMKLPPELPHKRRRSELLGWAICSMGGRIVIPQYYKLESWWRYPASKLRPQHEASHREQLSLEILLLTKYCITLEMSTEGMELLT